MTTDLLFKHFHLLADTPGGVQKLRDLILQLAVQGKLVPQDPEDEPASVLLERIREEKERLVNEGKIKKQKPLPEIKPEEVPFELPESWEWSRLRKVSHDFGQKQPDKEFTYIDVASIDNKTGRISGDLPVLQPMNAPSRARKIIDINTVLFSTVRPYLLNVTIVDKMFNPEPIASTAFAILNPHVGISSKYLFYYLRSNVFVDYVRLKMTGVAYPAISETNFWTGPIPVPPRTEQHRIVTKLDQFMALCDELEAKKEKQKTTHARLNKSALQALRESRTNEDLKANWTRVKNNFRQLFTTQESVQELRSTILQLAVQGKLVSQNPQDEPASALLERIREEKQRLVKEGKIKKQKPLPEIKSEEVPFELPEGWEWARLGTIAYQVTDGAHHTPEYVENGTPFLSVKDISSGAIDFSNTRRISNESHNSLVKRCNPEKGDLLLTKVGTTGIPVLVHTGKNFSIFVSIALIKFPKDKISGQFLVLLMKSPIVKCQSEAGTEGVGNKNLVLRKINNFILTIPPLPEQYRIVAKVDQLMGLCDELEASLSQSQADGERLMSAVVEEISGSRQESDTKLRNPANQGQDELASNTNHKMIDTVPAEPQPANTAPPNPEPSTAEISNPESDKSKSNNTAAAILAYMQPGEQYTRSDIMNALGLSASAWNTGIRELKEKGFVVQTGEKRGARYRL